VHWSDRKQQENTCEDRHYPADAFSKKAKNDSRKTRKTPTEIPAHSGKRFRTLPIRYKFAQYGNKH